MTRERAFLAIVGTMILLSVALTHFHHPYWMWFTVFIGINLFQFAFTGFCPLTKILKAAGLKSGQHI
jgi:hypothetical protein